MGSEIKRATTSFCGPAVDISPLALVFAPILPTELSGAMKVDAGGLGERESIAASGPQKLHHPSSFPSYSLHDMRLLRRHSSALPALTVKMGDEDSDYVTDVV